MLDRVHTPLQLVAAAAPPVEQLVLGRPVEEAAEMLPRIFNLCRGAQEVAVRLGFGLPQRDGWAERLAQEIARDHALKLGVLLPSRLGLPPLKVPADHGDLPQALYGENGFPQDGKSFETFLTGDCGIAPVLRAVDRAFGPAEAVSAGLPLVDANSAGRIVPVENSMAARHHDHPVMRHVAQTRGQGPLWRLVGRALDVGSALWGCLPAPRRIADTVLVPAARGLYAVRAQTTDGRVTAFGRVTPTDHLLAPDGVAAQSLATLPPNKSALAPLLLEILDPCVPVTLKGGAQDA